MDGSDPTNIVADVRGELVGSSAVSNCECDDTGVGFQGLHLISGGFTEKYGENCNQNSFFGRAPPDGPASRATPEKQRILRALRAKQSEG